MADSFKKNTFKHFSNGISCGDGWNASGYGHVKRRTKGRKKINRQARHRLKNDLRNDILENY